MMRKAIVTGHSRGLGEAMARVLPEQGYAVMGISRAKNAALEGCHQVALDLSDMDAVCDWLDEGALSDFLADADQAILVNNAGMIGEIRAVGRQNNRDIAKTVSLNVSAVMVLSNAFIHATSGTQDRRIVHISSGAARAGYPGWSIYCGTKAALDLHALSMVEDRIDNLRVSSLAPGIVDTDMQAGIRQADAADFPLLDDFKGFKADGDLASSEMVGRQIVDWLISDGFGDPTVSDIRRV